MTRNNPASSYSETKYPKMDQDSLMDMRQHVRSGAIPKRTQKSNYTAMDRCSMQENYLDERSEIDVERKEIGLRQMVDCMSVNGRDDKILKHSWNTSHSIGDSGVFDEIKESVNCFPSPTIHRSGRYNRNNMKQTFGDRAFSIDRRQDRGKEDTTGLDEGFFRHGYLNGDKTLGCFRRDMKRNGDMIALNRGSGRLTCYGSICDGVRRGSSEGRRSRNDTDDIDEKFEEHWQSWMEGDRCFEEGERYWDFRGDDAVRSNPEIGTLDKERESRSSAGDTINTKHISSRMSESSESLRTGHRGKAPASKEIDGKWPPFLWMMFKFLGLFWARPVIEERYCHRCYREKLRKVTGMVQSQFTEQEPVSSRRLSYLYTPEIGINDRIISDHPHSSFGDQLNNSAMEFGETSALITSNIKSDHCIVADEEGYSVNEHKQENDSETQITNRCRVCDALWWTGKGQYFKYTDKSIGLKSWNHRGSGMLSLFLLLTYLSLIIYDAGYYASIYWGKKQDLIRYISYMSYLIFTGSIPAICLIGLIRNAVTRPAARFTQWPRVLDIRYVVRRLQYLDLAESGLPCKPFLVACTVYPLLIAFYRLMFYVVVVKSTAHLLHNYLASLTTAIGLLLYGVFSYFIYLMRISFHPHLKLDVDFIWHHVGQLDVCRAKMSSTVQDFRNFRQLANGWMVMVIGITTWAIATQITWNYLLFSGILDKNDPFTWYSWMIQMYINGLMAMENIMFFFLPCFAIGGFNINIIWIRFRYHLLELRRARYERFWYRLLQFIKEQDPVESSMRITMLFTLISLFVALQFGEQNIYYYYNNITAHNIVPIPSHVGSSHESANFPSVILP